MPEIWKDIKGYEGLYQISNVGRVKSLPRNGTISTEKILKPHITKNHWYITLCKNSKCVNRYIHRLVAEAFIPNPLHLPEVNHIDQNPANNVSANLEWCTSKYNMTYSFGKKVQCIETGIIYCSLSDAESSTGISSADVSRVCHGKRTTAGGYHWKFI